MAAPARGSSTLERQKKEDPCSRPDRVTKQHKSPKPAPLTPAFGVAAPSILSGIRCLQDSRMRFACTFATCTQPTLTEFAAHDYLLFILRRLWSRQGHYLCLCCGYTVLILCSRAISGPLTQVIREPWYSYKQGRRSSSTLF